MIWIIDSEGNESYQIVGTNIHKKQDGTFALWATKPSGKTVLMVETEEIEYISDYKAAIDYAVSNGNKSFEI